MIYPFFSLKSFLLPLRRVDVSTVKQIRMTKQQLNIFLIGPGLVGKEFLNQIQAFQNSKLSLNVNGIMSSKFMKLSKVTLLRMELRLDIPLLILRA